MNRSIRLLRSPVLRSPSSLSPSTSALTKSTILSSRPAPSSQPIIIKKLPSKAVFKPSGIRLYVTSTPQNLAAKKGSEKGDKGDASKANADHVTPEEGIIGSAMSEAKGVVRDLASIISGGQDGSELPPASNLSGGASAVVPGPNITGVMAGMESSSHSHGGSVRDDFSSITRGLLQEIPPHIFYFGLAGTLPYLGTSLGTIFVAREAYRTGHGLSTITGMNFDTALDALHTMEAIQITYGAIILSFLGALHWGMEFCKYGGSQGVTRLVYGTLPLAFAWPTTFLTHGVALAAQWVGFTLTWFIDQKASTNGWTPRWFATYRFYLSIIVGFSIIATLAGEAHYGFGAGSDVGGDMQQPTSMSSTPTPRFDSNSAKDRARQKATIAQGGRAGYVKGKVGGDISVEEDESLGAYGRLRNKAKAAEEEEEEENGEEEEEKDEEGEDKEEK